MTAISPKGCPNPVSQQFSAPDPVGRTDGVLPVPRLDGTLCRGLVSPCPLANPSIGGFHGAGQPPREGVSFLHISTLHFCVRILVCVQKLINNKISVIK